MRAVPSGVAVLAAIALGAVGFAAAFVGGRAKAGSNVRTVVSTAGGGAVAAVAVLPSQSPRLERAPKPARLAGLIEPVPTTTPATPASTYQAPATNSYTPPPAPTTAPAPPPPPPVTTVIGG